MNSNNLAKVTLFCLLIAFGQTCDIFYQCDKNDKECYNNLSEFNKCFQSTNECKEAKTIVTCITQTCKPKLPKLTQQEGAIKDCINQFQKSSQNLGKKFFQSNKCYNDINKFRCPDTKDPEQCEYEIVSYNFCSINCIIQLNGNINESSISNCMNQKCQMKSDLQTEIVDLIKDCVSFFISNFTEAPQSQSSTSSQNLQLFFQSMLFFIAILLV